MLLVLSLLNLLPDYENPDDDNSDYIYEISVTAEDNMSHAATQDININDSA